MNEIVAFLEKSKSGKSYRCQFDPKSKNVSGYRLLIGFSSIK